MKIVYIRHKNVIQVFKRNLSLIDDKGQHSPVDQVGAVSLGSILIGDIGPAAQYLLTALRECENSFVNYYSVLLVLIFVQKYEIKIFAQEFARRIHNGQAETFSSAINTFILTSLFSIGYYSATLFFPLPNAFVFRPHPDRLFAFLSGNIIMTPIRLWYAGLFYWQRHMFRKTMLIKDA